MAAHATHDRQNEAVHEQIRRYREQGLLLRQDAARYLRISSTTFRRREEQGLFVPTKINERGWKLYSVDYLSKLEVKDMRGPNDPIEPRPAPPSNGGASGYDVDTARRVFDALDRHGEDLVRIVREQAIHPNVVQAAHAAWLALKKASGGFHVSGAEAREVAELDFDGLPVKTGASLVAFLRMLDAERRREPCASCGQAPREPGKACFGCLRDLELRRERELRELRDQRDEARAKARSARRAS